MADSKVMIGLIGPPVAVSGEFPRKTRNTVEWFSRQGTHRNAFDALKRAGFEPEVVEGPSVEWYSQEVVTRLLVTAATAVQMALKDPAADLPTLQSWLTEEAQAYMEAAHGAVSAPEAQQLRRSLSWLAALIDPENTHTPDQRA